MNLKRRFAFFYSLLFSSILAVVLLTVYTLFASFREEEFKERLEEKGKTTARLLVEVQEVDYQTLKIIDKNTINRLYDEKIMIFNDRFELIYSSLDDASINWSVHELKQIKEDKNIFRRNKVYDIYGMYYEFENKDYYVLVSAEDKYGNSKLTYLRYLLTGAFVAGSVLVWLLSFRLSKRVLLPLDRLRKRIVEISGQNLNSRLPVTSADNEIQTLTAAFNQMMERIDHAYNLQKEFNANASHELRTPIARIVAQLENLIRARNEGQVKKENLKNILEDGYELSDVVSSLLVLSDTSVEKANSSFKTLRLDELVFLSAERMQALNPDFRFKFEIEESGFPVRLDIRGDESLLGIAFNNLFRNAYSYSENGQVACKIRSSPGCVEVIFINTGAVPITDDPSHLFQPYARGSNAIGKAGTGIGLSIVKRILQYHGADIRYELPDSRTNEITVRFCTD